MGNVDADKWITHLTKRKDEIALKISGLQAEQKHIEAFINILRPTGDGRVEVTVPDGPQPRECK